MESGPASDGGKCCAYRIRVRLDCLCRDAHHRRHRLGILRCLASSRNPVMVCQDNRDVCLWENMRGRLGAPGRGGGIQFGLSVIDLFSRGCSCLFAR
eukprot:2986852-Rhodomonas_salina.4